MALFRSRSSPIAIKCVGVSARAIFNGLFLYVNFQLWSTPILVLNVT